MFECYSCLDNVEICSQILEIYPLLCLCPDLTRVTIFMQAIPVLKAHLLRPDRYIFPVSSFYFIPPQADAQNTSFYSRDQRLKVRKRCRLQDTRDRFLNQLYQRLEVDNLPRVLP